MIARGPKFRQRGSSVNLSPDATALRVRGVTPPPAMQEIEDTQLPKVIVTRGAFEGVHGRVISRDGDRAMIKTELAPGIYITIANECVKALE